MARPRSLILGSGGGTRGALHPYILERLEEETDIACMVGTSINAVQSYAVCTENTGALRGIWLDLKAQTDFMRRNLPHDGLHSLKPLRKLMEEQRWGMPTREMHVGIFNWESGRHEIWRCNDRPVDDVIELAIVSSSILGIHDDVTWQGVERGDGGHWSALPVPNRWWNQYDEVHVLLSRPYKLALPALAKKQVNGLLEKAMRYSDVSTHRSLRLTMQRIRRMAARRPDIPFYVYAPKNWRLTGPTFVPDNREFRELTRARLQHGLWMFENRERL